MQILINGIISGLSIALLAVAFQVVYLPTRVFFIGLAGVYAIAPYLVYTCLDWGMGWLLSICLMISGSIGIAVLCEWGSHARLARRGASSGAHLIASLGMYIILVQTIAMIWGNNPKTLRTGLDVVSHLGNVTITGAQWIILCSAVFLLSSFCFFLSKSSFGNRMRALADNPNQFALVGYNVDRYRLLAFGLAGMLASTASFVTSYDIGFDPYTGLHTILIAVVAVIIGGRTTFTGPILGALLLGILRAMVVWYWSARWQEATTFVVLAAVLLFLPEGLLGRKNRVDTAI